MSTQEPYTTIEDAWGRRVTISRDAATARATARPDPTRPGADHSRDVGHQLFGVAMISGMTVLLVLLFLGHA